MHTALIEEFERYLDARYSSHHTKRAYMKDVEEFLSHSFGFDIEGVERFESVLFKKGLSSKSINRKLASLSVFFEFLKQKGIVEKNPVKLVDKPKQKKSLPKFLEVDELVGLLESVKDKRDRALLELLYSTGLRVSELVSLNVEDVDFDNLRLKVRRKGGRVMYVPFGRRAGEYLLEYLKGRKTGPLFLNRYNNRISDRMVRKIIKRYALGSIFKDISPHTLRHTRATHLLNSGMDLRLLQRFLGHSSIRATQIYTHLNLKELSDVYDKTHPIVNDE
ncbi:site-specific tyrosine recombinase/integron integrase [Hippea alviniae]|uniref:site-specific tyrosine recombinase/integron integrase n=1 Tax=Hippea alviniae TaxID=1279027 RepID=UPI0003B51EB9|nr:site-specific tyrosine recombinase/integron integrase [Hippea alviniae]